MIKNCLFAVALLSLALAGGCAKGGNGIVPQPPMISINGPADFPFNSMYPTQSVALTATVGTTTPMPVAVTWSVGPASACTGTPNPCGTLTPASPPTAATYVAPATPISGVEITATSLSDSSETGSVAIAVIPVSVVVTPLTVTVGESLVQQFTAIAVPVDAPQSFTWSVTCNSNQGCGSIAQDSAVVATYTAPSNAASVTVQAAWNPSPAPNPAPTGQSSVAVVASRLPAGTYSFQFSGYDNSNNAVAAAGSFVLASNGSIPADAGVEDVLSIVPPNTLPQPQQYPIASVSYVPISSSNNLGTLTLALTGGPTNQYTAVPTSSGIIRMIESDGMGTGSGVMQKSATPTVFNADSQRFVFGFAGVDSSLDRVGSVGLLPMTPSASGGTISGGALDANDNGSVVCNPAPCSIATSSVYSQPDGSLSTYWNMTLITGSTTQHFDFFVAGGGTTSQTTPLTLYAMSTDPTDATHPALAGSMVYQWPGTMNAPITYNNKAFCPTTNAACTSVSNLTGANANVSLTLGTTDGTSGGTGGTGGFTGTFDQNNNGTITSVGPAAPFSYTYVATTINTNEYLGRYTFSMLGNPNASPVVNPLTFILYASGANRGFLLDQSSSSVMTGTMNPQPTNLTGNYAPSELPGIYAASTITTIEPSIVPVVENLILTSPGGIPPASVVGGTLNPGGQALTGAYTLTLPGTGTITLTNPTLPAVPTSVIYAIDATTVANPASPTLPNYVITDFMMMGTCTPQGTPATCSSGPPSSIIFAQQ
ncbi:MAG TPA: hypothetical protein VIX14_05255 [Terriglobales bacterium]